MHRARTRRRRHGGVAGLCLFWGFSPQLPSCTNDTTLDAPPTLLVEPGGPLERAEAWDLFFLQKKKPRIRIASVPLMHDRLNALTSSCFFKVLTSRTRIVEKLHAAMRLLLVLVALCLVPEAEGLKKLGSEEAAENPCARVLTLVSRRDRQVVSRVLVCVAVCGAGSSSLFFFLPLPHLVPFRWVAWTC
jgi:hypothetical protein